MAQEHSQDEKPADSAAKRVLLVDDDAEIIEAMRYTLEAKGYQILVARVPMRDVSASFVMEEIKDTTALPL